MKIKRFLAMKKFGAVAVLLAMLITFSSCGVPDAETSYSTIPPAYAAMVSEMYISVGKSGKWFYDQYGIFCLQYEVAIRYALTMNGETMNRSDVVNVLIPLQVLT